MAKSATTTTDEPHPDVADDALELTVWEQRRKRIYKEALREALIEFGMDPAQPLEMQQDMAWVRKRRILEQSTFVKTIGLIIGAVVTGVIGAVVYSLQRYFH